MSKVRGLTILCALAATALLASGGLGGPQAAADSGTVSPLSNYLGFGYHPDQEEALYDSQEEQRQQLIASCMQAAGFTYIASLPDVLIDLDTDLDTLPADPNEAIREALSPSDLAAYNLALAGVADSEGDISPAEMAAHDSNGDGRLDRDERADMGCIGSAQSLIPGVYAIQNVLHTQLAALDVAITNDVLAQTAQTTWRTCINAATGFAANQEAILDGFLTSVLTATQQAAVEVCDTVRDTAMAAVRLTHETLFYAQNAAVIEALATPAS